MIMQSLYMPPPGVPVVCMLRFNIIIAQTMESQREEKDKRYQCGNRNSKEFPTAKGCQHLTAKGSHHYPKIHLSVSSLHSRSRNLQKGLHSGICLPLSGWTYHHRTSVAGPKFHTFIPHPSNLHTYPLDLPPQNSSGRPKTPHSQPPPFQPPSLSPPSFHHVRRKSLPCFHGCCQ